MKIIPLSQTLLLDKQLEKEIEAYLEITGMEFSELIHQAVKSYLSVPRWVFIDSKAFLPIAKAAELQYQAALEQMK